MMQNRRAFILSAAALSAAPAWAQGVSGRTCYTFEFANFEGPPMRLGDFAGKPVLVVNTASLCGYTPQYAGLQKLWEKMGPRGLVMIGAPCNDFGGQEPGGRAEIMATVENYKVTFPIVAKVAVKGPEAHPFYRWAAMERPRETPQWNFHKYLVGRDGHIAASIPTAVEPLDTRVLSAIEKEFSSGPA
jgi:glutathione peroxidase